MKTSENHSKLLKRKRTTILITTHYIEEARQASVVGLMRNGYLLAEENPVKLMENYNLATLEDVFLKLCMNQNNQVNILLLFFNLLNILYSIACDPSNIHFVFTLKSRLQLIMVRQNVEQTKVVP